MYSNCGTYAGYRKHHNHKTKPCAECLVACAEFSRKRYQATIDRKRMLARQRNADPKRKVYIKEYKKKNKEHILNMNRAYVEANREKVAEQKKQWKIDNPEKNLEHNRKADYIKQFIELHDEIIPWNTIRYCFTFLLLLSQIV
jgi:hypothetical protein